MVSEKLIALAATSLFALSIASASASTDASVDNVPSNLSLATDHGLADPAQIITIIVHLKLQNQDLFDKTLNALYDPHSATYHHWLTDADLAAFAPAAKQAAAVRASLEAYGLSIVSVDKNGFSMRVRGTLGNVSKAFNTEIHQFDHNGRSFRANTRNAVLGGAAGSYIDVVAGIESHTVRPMVSRAINMKTKKPYAGVAVSVVEASGGLGSLITDVILSPPATFTYTTPGEALPTATYSGIVYGASTTLVPDYSAKALEHVYGLEAAYAKGLNGAGQTVVLLEGYGYPTMKADGNEAAKLNSLPAFTNTNFKIVYPEGKPDPQAGILTGWNVEIALDIDSSHAIAPGATTLVVVTAGQNSEDFQASMQYIIDNKLGTAVSDSWEEDTDLVSGPAEQNSFEKILKVGAAKGISFQFSTGDSGDGGLGTPIGAAGVPSVAPHATAVGGTAILNPTGGTTYTSVGWGDALAYIDGDGPYDPPFAFFYAGGGGGESTYWPRPAWQPGLPGLGRQTPDVSALADPFTGIPIVVTDPTTKKMFVYPGYGGTSLASPIFTAFWVLATQDAGKPLGQASPIIARLKTGLVDVLPIFSKNNISGSITDSSGTTDYTAAKLFKGYIPDGQKFIGAVWDEPEYEEALGFGFALDSSLNVTPGWDNATGYGTPYGLAFIEAVAAAK